VPDAANLPGTTGELLVRPALELARLVRSGEVGTQELVEATLRRLEAREGRINAFCFVDADRALTEAERISPGDPRPFAGIPIAIKDGTPQERLRMRIGSALFEDYVADHDGASIKRLKEAGFILVGRTTMPEFGIVPTTEPRLTGPTCNPCNLSRTPADPLAALLRRSLRASFLWLMAATVAVRCASPPPAAVSSGSKPRVAASRLAPSAATTRS
jgi:hypothetical protein